MRTFQMGLLILAAFTVAFSQAAIKRDLKRYENGGKFDFSWGNHTPHEEMRARLREFLWSAWTSKRLSTVEADFYSIEGDPTINRFYVEPDKKGLWRVVRSWQSWCCWWNTSVKRSRRVRRTTGTEVYIIVERVVRADEKSTGPIGPLWSWKAIPSDDARSADKYFLLLQKNSLDHTGWDL